MIKLDVIMPPLSYEIQELVQKYKYPLLVLLGIELIIIGVIVYKIKRNQHNDNNNAEFREDNFDEYK